MRNYRAIKEQQDEALSWIEPRIHAFVTRHGKVEHHDIIDYIEQVIEARPEYQIVDGMRMPQAAILFMLDRGDLTSVHGEGSWAITATRPLAPR